MAMNTIPTISTLPGLDLWKANLRNTLRVPAAAPIPANVTIASKQGGNYITWSAMNSADGYRVDVSETGDFSVLLTSVMLTGNQATAYFDSVPTSAGGAPKKRYYQVRSTAGTIQNPHTVVGKPSASVNSTAIAPNDTVTASTTVRDVSDRDRLVVSSADGNYRIPRLPST